MNRSILAIGLLLLFAISIAAVASQSQKPVERLPDLVIEKIYLTKGCHVAGVVKNLGPGIVPDEVWTQHIPKSAGIYIHRNGTKWGGVTIWKLDPAMNLKNPGGTTNFVTNLSVTGTTAIKAEVDIWNVVIEADDGNNSKQLKLTCKEQQTNSESEKTRSYWYDPPIVLPMWPIWPDIDSGSGTSKMCERCILNCMGDHTYEYCRTMCERSGRCKPITSKPK